MFTAEESARLNMMAQELRSRASPQDIEIANQRINAFPIEQRERWQQQNVDPLHMYFRNQAIQQYIRQKARLRDLSAQQQMRNPGTEGALNAAQQNRPMPSNLSHQPAQQFGGNLNVYGDQVLGLQQDAMRSQEAGQMVVPVSDHQRISQLQQPRQPIQQGFPMQPNAQGQMMNRPDTAAAMANHNQFIVQQEKIKEATRIRNQAQAQAQNSANVQIHGQLPNNLQGQIGGLNNLSGQNIPRRSPAMPNLNRPMGDSVPQVNLQGTPQQRDVEQVRQQVHNGSELTMQRSSSNVQQPGQFPERLAMAGNGVQERQHFPIPLPLQQQMANMNPEQRKQAFALWQHKQMMLRDRQRPTGLPPAPVENPSNVGVNNQTNRTQAPPTQNLGQRGPPQMPVTQAMPNGGQSTNNPQENSVGATPVQQNNASQGQNFQPSSQQFLGHRPIPALTEVHLQRMDRMRYPPTILDRIQLKNIPAGVITWGDLKAWAARNMDVHGGSLPEQLLHLQSYHFQALLAKNQQERGRGKNMVAGQELQVSVSTPQQGPAPPAPMANLRNNATFYPQANQNSDQIASQRQLSQILTASDQEVQSMRATYQQVQGYSDDQVKHLIVQKKRLAMQMRAQQPDPQQRSRAEELQRLRNEQLPGRVLGLQGAQISQVQSSLQVEQARPAVNSQNNWTAASLGAQASNQSRQGRNAATNLDLAQQSQQGVKRNSEDDPVEVSNSNELQESQQRRKIGPTKASQLANNNEKQSTTGPQASSQYEMELRNQAMRRMPSTSAQQLQTEVKRDSFRDQERHVMEEKNRKTQRLVQLYKQVLESMKPAIILSLDPSAKQKIGRLLQDSRIMLIRNEHLLKVLFDNTEDENLTMDLIHTVGSFLNPVCTVWPLNLAQHLLIVRQCRNKEFLPKEEFSITPEKLEECLLKLKSHFKDIMEQHHRRQGQPNSVQERNPELQAETGSGIGSTTIDGVKSQKQSVPQSLQVRQMSTQKNQGMRDNKAPAAPTSDKPPFSFETPSPTPHGVPKFYGPNTITQDNLRFPPVKKKKPNQPGSSVSTPMPTHGTPICVSSPHVNKAPSPRSQRSDTQASIFKCPNPDCDFGEKGFATMSDLAKHKEEAHKPQEPVIDDPLVWALESVRFGLGLTENGEVRQNGKGQHDTKIGAQVSSMKKTVSMQGMTLLKPEGSTPMTRASTHLGPITNSNGHQAIVAPRVLPASRATDTNSKTIPAGSDAKTEDSGQKETLLSSIDPWKDCLMHPSDFAACFPTVTDLQGSMSITSLTPASTLSTPASEKTSPKANDGVDEMEINLESGREPWLPPVWFQKSMRSKDDFDYGDDLMLDMEWECNTPLMSRPSDRKKESKKMDLRPENSAFDLSFFYID